MAVLVDAVMNAADASMESWRAEDLSDNVVLLRRVRL